MKNMCICDILFIKLNSNVRLESFASGVYLSPADLSEDGSPTSSLISERYGWHANCSTCSAFRSCRSNRAGISRDVSPGNSSSSNFVTRLRRTSRTKSRGYMRQGLYVDACALRMIDFYFDFYFPSPDT